MIMSIDFGVLLPSNKYEQSLMVRIGDEIAARRRINLKAWIDNHFDGKQAAFVEHTGINQGELSALLRDKSFGEKKARTLEHQAGMPDFWLDEESETKAGPDLRGKVPLISWVQAGQWCEISDQFQPGDAESWRETTAKVSSGAFALRIIGDSMEPAIPRGAVVIVDPAIEATNGRVVVVRQNGDSEATIKRLVIEGGVRFLKPDNPRYPIMEMRTDAVICGVAIKVEQDL